MIPQSNNQNNIERAILSTYIFEPKELEKATITYINFENPFYQNVFKTIQSLQKEMIPIDEDFIERKMGKDFNQDLYLELISANPISNVRAYEYQMIQYYTQQKYHIEVKKIEENTEFSFLEKVHKIETISNEVKKEMQPQNNLFNILTMKDIEPQTPVFFLRDELPIQKGEITLISASGGSGKSFVALWLASMLSKEGKKVFAYLSEDSTANSRNRLNILKKTNPNLSLGFEIMGKECRPQPFIAKEEKNFIESEYFLQFKTFFSKYEIIIIDPLIAFILEDENNNVEARFLLNILNEWCEKEGKTLVLIHHHNKGNEVRGATAFIDAVRLHYTVKKKENNNTSRFLKLEKSNHYVGKNEFEIVLFEESIGSNRKPSDTKKFENQGADNGRSKN